MRPGKASRTAVLVCAARAVAHDQAIMARFSDATALALLPEAARARVLSFRQGQPKRLPARLRYEFAKARAAMMAVRSVFVDDAIREGIREQVVILGAGLDGRAWRMPELQNTVVFEVDHPDSQRYKLERIGALTQAAREVKFVAVDFTRDDLAAALAAAGHDPARPTTWLWEGVVMYLTLDQIEATLARVKQLSAARSRLIVVYMAPGRVLLRVVSVLVRAVGEPFRSRFTAEQLRAVLARYRFEVVRDEDLVEATERLAPSLLNSVRRMRHLRLAVADIRAE